MTVMTTLPSLYVLADQYVQLMHTLADGDFDAQTVADTLESVGIVDDIKVKAQNIEMVARNLLQYDAALDAEIERLKALQARRRANAERLRHYLKIEMEHMGITKIECPLFSLSVRKNPAGVDAYEPKLIPKKYWRQKPAPPAEIDKTSIQIAWRDGYEVPGAKKKETTRLVVS